MRIIFAFLLILFSNTIFSQIKFPKEFKLIKGENGAGRDDYYTNGRCSFDNHYLFADHDYKVNDDSVKNYISEVFGFRFNITKDGFYLGTGLVDGFYKYVIVTSNGDAIELYSQQNDKEFSKYSVWLLSTIREYRKHGKNYSYPIHFH